MKRIALGVSYDGAAYHGWQNQDNELPTLQFFVENAVARVANHPVNIVCAGRTDARVHATNQVIHFDTDAERTDYSWVFGANSNLPHDISVMWAKEVSTEFHARFSATARRYRYIIYTHKVRPAILRDAVTWNRNELDMGAMQLAATYLLGKHDFSSFRGSGCQAKSAIRDLQELTIKRYGQLLVIEVLANAFLLHMVRNLVGVLLPIGLGTHSPDWAKEVLDARNRSAGGVTTAPNGLYLVAISYPQHYDLPKTSLGPFFLQ
ncbi:MAG: tRNA pseudouridine(38-40) synthase TruA [Coxiella sp. (in: Bacteria)]|nr:MAG: tRNA pseudouridine(38-40) synthase TruA [Coxiella sp. (in: g-proteobacteria)]